MKLGHRSTRAVLRAPLEAGHYRALLGMVLRYPDLLDSGRRYLTGNGRYPWCCRVRTPTGIVSPTLYSSHDMSTVNEIFCREDYAAGQDLGVAVDVGSNIGISAIYFLTRNRTSRVYLFEPDPRNVSRLRANLSAYEGRFALEQVAVGTCEGDASFAVEPTGRYGSLLGGAERDSITVRVKPIVRLLEHILAKEGKIDVLKIDTEGTECELVEAIPPHVLEHISTIYYETDHPTRLHTDRYRFHFSCQTNRLTARS